MNTFDKMMRGEYEDDHQELVVKNEHDETVKSDPESWTEPILKPGIKELV